MKKLLALVLTGGLLALTTGCPSTTTSAPRVPITTAAVAPAVTTKPVVPVITTAPVVAPKAMTVKIADVDVPKGMMAEAKITVTDAEEATIKFEVPAGSGLTVADVKVAKGDKEGKAKVSHTGDKTGDFDVKFMSDKPKMDGKFKVTVKP